MKFLFELFPIALFFIAYKFGNLYIATITAIIASFFQVAWLRLKTGRFEMMPLVTLVIITLMGGATVIFKNEMFIKWKPTVVYWILALAFLLSHWLGEGKPLLQRIAERSMQLPRTVWLRLNASWVLFFTGMGGLNLFVVHHFDTDTWVNFKLFGTLGLTLLFIIVQAVYMLRHQATVPVESNGTQPKKQD